jgi:hypothetical protein
VLGIVPVAVWVVISLVPFDVPLVVRGVVRAIPSSTVIW